MVHLCHLYIFSIIHHLRPQSDRWLLNPSTIYSPLTMVSLSKVRHYKPEEIDIKKLVEKADQIFHKWPFEWQLDVPRVVLCGEDVVVDVGTGSGKTLCFSLPLLLDEMGTEIILTISPLTVLMIDQVKLFKQQRDLTDLASRPTQRIFLQLLFVQKI